MDSKTVSAWAVYRLPYTDEPVLVAQTGGTPAAYSALPELNQKEGFLFAPFYTGGDLPVLLIRPDEVRKGWKEVADYQPFQEHLAQIEASFVSTPTAGQNEEKLDYLQTFDTFLAALRQGDYHKLVLSRKKTTAATDMPSLWEAYRQACACYPRMMIYLCYTPQAGVWMGCSPELILSGSDTHWHTVALAGTLALEGEELPALWNLKNSMEQQYVSDYLRPLLQSVGTIEKEEGPYPVQAGRLAHLKTDFYFTLPSATHLGDVLRLLHPTPAVCGLPKEEAHRFIVTHEGYDRRYYAGIVGWLSPLEVTELYVNLRCAEMLPSQTVYYAGGGILPQSEFLSEWEETEEKMKTMRRILCT